MRPQGPQERSTIPVDRQDLVLDMVDVECMKHLEPTGVENGAVSELLDLVGLYQGLPLDEDCKRMLLLASLVKPLTRYARED